MQAVSPLTITKFTKRYGSFSAVDDLNLKLDHGEVFGFLGPNGAGKSTTIRTMMNFISPTMGSIKLFDLDSTLDSVKIKEYVGYLAGDIALYGSMSGKALLNYLTALGKNTDWTFVTELVQRLDVPVTQRIGTLSKGNRQKLGLIQAFMHKPDMLILDEPTSGLDPLKKQVIYDMILDMKNMGKTAFISSHDLTEVQRICDRVGFIRSGKLVAIENMNTVNNLNVRKYAVIFDTPPAVENLLTTEGVIDAKLNGNQATVTVKGRIDQFISLISEYSPRDLQEQTTSLEDIFMSYYETD